MGACKRQAPGKVKGQGGAVGLHVRCVSKRPALLSVVSDVARDGGNGGGTSCQSAGCDKPTRGRSGRVAGAWAFLKEGVDGAMSVDNSLEKEK